MEKINKLLLAVAVISLIVSGCDSRAAHYSFSNSRNNYPSNTSETRSSGKSPSSQNKPSSSSQSMPVSSSVSSSSQSKSSSSSQNKSTSSSVSSSSQSKSSDFSQSIPISSSEPSSSQSSYSSQEPHEHFYEFQGSFLNDDLRDVDLYQCPSCNRKYLQIAFNDYSYYSSTFGDTSGYTNVPASLRESVKLIDKDSYLYWNFRLNKAVHNASLEFGVVTSYNSHSTETFASTSDSTVAKYSIKVNDESYRDMKQGLDETYGDYNLSTTQITYLSFASIDLVAGDNNVYLKQANTGYRLLFGGFVRIYYESDALPATYGEHIHVPDSEWHTNDTSHWHECKYGDGFKTDEGEHDWQTMNTYLPDSFDQVSYQRGTCDVDGMTIIKIKALDATLGDNSSIKSDTPSGFFKLSSNGESASWKFYIPNSPSYQLNGNLYQRGYMDNFSYNTTKTYADTSSSTSDAIDGNFRVTVNGFTVDKSSMMNVTYEEMTLNGESSDDIGSDLSPIGLCKIGGISLTGGVNEIVYERLGSFNLIISDLIFIGQVVN